VRLDNRVVWKFARARVCIRAGQNQISLHLSGGRHPKLSAPTLPLSFASLPSGFGPSHHLILSPPPPSTLHPPFSLSLSLYFCLLPSRHLSFSPPQQIVLVFWVWSLLVVELALFATLPKPTVSPARVASTSLIRSTPSRPKTRPPLHTYLLHAYISACVQADSHIIFLPDEASALLSNSFFSPPHKLRIITRLLGSSIG